MKLSNSIGLGHFIRLVDLQKKLNPKHAIWIIAGKNKIIYSYLKKIYIQNNKFSEFKYFKNFKIKQYY